MTAIARILCPVDFSEFSRHALEHASALARWYGANLTVLHAFSAAVPPVAVSAPDGTPMLPPLDAAEVSSRLQQFCAESRGTEKLAVDFLVEEGEPARVIASVARDRAPDLLVLGTHGHGGFERLFLGSVTEKVMRSTDVPVLTVPPRSGPPADVLYKTLLCPVDFSDASTRALEFALSLAKEADARLVLLHVVEPFPEQLQAAPIAHLNREDRAQIVEETTRLLASAVPADAASWCTPEIKVAFGKAEHEILGIAAAVEADAIVLGVHGKGLVERWLFGSTAPRIVREASCPVLTVRG